MGRLLLCLVVFLTLSTRCALADDEQVWAALKEGGKVILLRHTHVDIREGIGHLAPGNCAEEVNLSASGVEQAKHIGDAFRAHGIAVGEVLTSPYCRCIDTGELAFGRATPVQYLIRTENLRSAGWPHCGSVGRVACAAVQRGCIQ